MGTNKHCFGYFCSDHRGYKQWRRSSFRYTFAVTNTDVREQVSPALPVLAKKIRFNDIEVQTDACWAISYLSDGPNEKIQAVVESGVCRRLVELL
ncbi:hypothetical protein HK096_010144 [Nowakowskiella sp. JEL0078]|nr:hypothetical protein HK096_010144 [Nowakowskiella sp. JEL0078]